MGRRNIQGGNKAKAMARNSGHQNDREIRRAEDDDEEYAIVTAVCGSGRFRVTSESKKNYTGIVPGSMRGSKKRNNYVQAESIVLINNRSSWQTQKELAPVDIMHVYSTNHIAELGLKEKFPDQLQAKFGSNRNQVDETELVFQANATNEINYNTKTITTVEEVEDVVDIDLI